MITTPATIDVPLRTDEHGVIRIGKTRVTLTTLISFYQQGESPEQLVEDFDVLTLKEVYAVIAYYLEHTDEVDEYIRQQRAEGERIRREMETNHPEMFRAQEKFKAILEERRRTQK